MKVSTIFPVLLLSLLDFASAGDFENAVACGAKFPRIMTAIDVFCQKKKGNGQLANDLVCPSPWANYGFQFQGLSGNQIHIHITGNCSPAQWIPVNYCTSQFHEVCAKSTSKFGYNSRRYGNNGCQNFIIEAMRK